MSRRHGFVLSLAIGLIAIVGAFAATRTVGLGNSARRATDTQVAQRTAALDRYAASLRKALAQDTPQLPALPAGAATAAAPAQTTQPIRVVYHRPPPVVIHQHRSDGGDDQGESREYDD